MDEAEVDVAADDKKESQRRIKEVLAPLQQQSTPEYNHQLSKMVQMDSRLRGVESLYAAVYRKVVDVKRQIVALRSEWK